MKRKIYKNLRSQSRLELSRLLFKFSDEGFLVHGDMELVEFGSSSYSNRGKPSDSGNWYYLIKMVKEITVPLDISENKEGQEKCTP